MKKQLAASPKPEIGMKRYPKLRKLTYQENDK
jgi:hypothetical protein